MVRAVIPSPRMMRVDGEEAGMDGASKLRAGLAFLRFRADIALRLDYQPLPWLGLQQARRGQGTRSRWRVIEALVDEYAITSAADIGCQVGYFPIALARKGIPTVGIDTDARALRIARYASTRLGLTNTAWWHLGVTPETARLLPAVDLTLVLSIWHHWVHDYGLDGANQMLGVVWARTRAVLFFETGEREMPAAWGL